MNDKVLSFSSSLSVLTWSQTDDCAAPLCSAILIYSTKIKGRRNPRSGTHTRCDSSRSLKERLSAAPLTFKCQFSPLAVWISNWLEMKAVGDWDRGFVMATEPVMDKKLFSPSLSVCEWISSLEPIFAVLFHHTKAIFLKTWNPEVAMTRFFASSSVLHS